MSQLPAVPAKITLCGSIAHYGTFRQIKTQLEADGFLVQLPEIVLSGDTSQANRHQAMHVHFAKIRQADCVIVVNPPKCGIANYIGASTLMEMAVAASQGKPVLLLHDVPEQADRREEILAIGPGVLRGQCTPKAIRQAYAVVLAHPLSDPAALRRAQGAVLTYGRPPAPCGNCCVGIMVRQVSDDQVRYLLQRQDSADWLPVLDHKLAAEHTIEQAAHRILEAATGLTDAKLTRQHGGSFNTSRLCHSVNPMHYWSVYQTEVGPDEVIASGPDTYWATWSELEVLLGHDPLYRQLFLSQATQ